MRERVGLRRGNIGILFVVFLMLSTSSGISVNVAEARDYHFSGIKPLSYTLPGGWAALANPATGELYTSTDPLVDGYAYPVIYDTGASGNLMSRWVRDLLEIPLTGETYQDQGIGGYETFDVSERTRLMLAPISIPADTVEDDINNFSVYGDFKFQVRQAANESTPYDIVGTPVLRHKVMHVEPNNTPYTGLICSYMNTELSDSVPSNVVNGALGVAIDFRDFVDDDTVPVDVDYNPVIPDMRIIDARKPAGQQSEARDWLLDTGASTTIIGRNYAAEIGIDLDNETPVQTIQVTGVGGQIREMYGYEVDGIVMPLINGDEVIFDDVVVFVPEAGALPADLTGILGMNLLGKSYSQMGLFGPVDEQDSNFSDWYVDGLNEVLYLQPLTVPLPGMFALMLPGFVCLFLSRIRKGA